MQNQVIRASVRSLYDQQKLRIQNGNRIVAAFRVKLGIAPGAAEETTGDEEQDMLKELRSEFKRITDGVKRVTKSITIDSPLITSLAELQMIEAYERMLESESIHEKVIQNELISENIYKYWLYGVRGVGPLMAGVIVSEIDIAKCNSISALWAYAGLDVVVSKDETTGEQREEGRCRKVHHLVQKTYTNRAGETVETRGITFNPFLKTKLVGVLADVFIKLGGPYRDIYDGYKHRLENHPKHKAKTKGHRHNMAKRYMIKEFLADLWTHWRELEGLPVRSRYNEEKLGLVHSKAA